MAVIAKFERKCPWCESELSLGERILGSAKKRGLVSPGFEWYPVTVQLQPPSDPLQPPLIGTILPTAIIYSDICLGCGRSYTVKIIEAGAQVTDVEISDVTGQAGRPRM
jgi:hypothetical protein